MEAFIAESVVPDAIDAAPAAVLKMSFASSEVAPGGNVTPTQAAEAPALSWEAEAGALYTVVMSGLDAPTRMDRSKAEIMFWLVTNVPGNDISKGTVLAEYAPIAPINGTGMHRFTVLVYKQSEPTEDSKMQSKLDAKSAAGRSGRSVRKLAQSWNMGTPCAGNFFIAEYDSSVDARIAALTNNGNWQ